MVDVSYGTITMDEGDFGIPLSFSFKGNLEGITKAELIIKKDLKDEEIIILKDVTPDNENSSSFSFTKEDTEKLSEGKYYWGIKFYEDDKVLNTVVSGNSLVIRRCV